MIPVASGITQTVVFTSESEAPDHATSHAPETAISEGMSPCSSAADTTGIGRVRLVPSFSAATVAGAFYRVDEHTPYTVRKFLSQSLSNNRYDSVEELMTRAENYLAYIRAEEKLIEIAHSSLQNIQSSAFRQSAWLCHLERGVWQSEPTLERLNRENSNNAGAETAQVGSELPYVRPWPWSLSPPSASTVSMMVKGEAGPLTLEQARTGFESVQEGVLASKLLKVAERKTYRAAHRHDAHRNGTHPTKTPEGTDLSRDTGTRIRDALKVPVMTGTSGSSSDVALAARYGARHAGLSWMAPGLDRDAAATAMIDLALQFFRTEGSSPTVYLARKMNEMRSKLGLPAKEVEANQVFSHSYAEIHAGVNLTLEEVSPTDPRAIEQALIELTQKAKERLDAAKALREAEQPHA
ncbi:hypothetical protein OKW34_000308 [Paraburkholderia youngii]